MASGLRQPKWQFKRDAPVRSVTISVVMSQGAGSSDLYQNVKREQLGITGESVLQHYFTRRTMPGALSRQKRSLAETNMRKTAFTILATLLMAGSAVQMAAASEHHMRAGRGHHHGDYRGAYNQLKERSAPAANEARSRDVIWCYPD